MKVVISECFGGWSLSEAACKELGLEGPYDGIERHDPRLVKLVEDWGSEAVSGHFANLVVVEIPDGTSYHVSEYDGWEEIHTNHVNYSSDGESHNC